MFSALTIALALAALSPSIAAEVIEDGLTVPAVSGLASDRTPFATPSHPAIRYAAGPTNNAVAALGEDIESGKVQLKYDDASGYLPAVLEALHIPVESQILVFSKTSLQKLFIGPKNPRAIYFRDDVAVGYIRNAPMLEIVAHDVRQGAVFYVIDQRPGQPPSLGRRDGCLGCHESYNTVGVPGLLARSVAADSNGVIFPRVENSIVDHRSPFATRWAGRYLTATAAPEQHLANLVVSDDLQSQSILADGARSTAALSTEFDFTGYPSRHSDIVAHLVFDHQMHMLNLLTRIGWDARAALYGEQHAGSAPALTEALLANIAREVVDYMLFVDETPLAAPVAGESGFAKKFATAGPRDRNGRSLRQLDLQSRLMNYPCSYLIYSAAFDALPDQARAAIYGRMWQVLSGADTDEKYRRLAPSDRRAVVEILRETKEGLPGYFK